MIKEKARPFYKPRRFKMDVAGNGPRRLKFFGKLKLPAPSKFRDDKEVKESIKDYFHA